MKRVVVLYGGRSSEHPISCLSARSVLEAVDRDRYEVLAVGITRDGRWTLTSGTIEALDGRTLPEVADDGRTVALVGTRHGPQLVGLEDDSTPAEALGPVDVAFPVLHGPWGEDGTVQGLLATVGVPYVGADVTASSIGIDKVAMKASFAVRGLPQGAYVPVERTRWAADPVAVAAEVQRTLPLPWFTKPARQGSSIGISKVRDPRELPEAMAHALHYDDVAIVEEGLERPRELEVGVLGHEDLDVTAPGEIVPVHDFYDFDAKYLDASELIVPAQLPTAVAAEMDRISREAYRAIGCRGMARVDFLLGADGRLLLNEINTIPGFTPKSMFPLLWAAEGLDYPALVDRLLASAAT